MLAGNGQQLTGWLGAFTCSAKPATPSTWITCRCNACVAACPEDAIGLDYQVDMVCQGHRACVAQCEVAGAIHFGPRPAAHTDTASWALDLRPSPAFTQHAPPQGYWHIQPGGRPLR